MHRLYCVNYYQLIIKLFRTQCSIVCPPTADESNIYLVTIKTTIYFGLAAALNANAKTRKIQAVRKTG